MTPALIRCGRGTELRNEADSLLLVPRAATLLQLSRAASHAAAHFLYTLLARLACMQPAAPQQLPSKRTMNT